MEEKELHQKSYTRVIEYIKEQIRSGNLALGSKLPAERDLSAILGISRSSVREAIRTLDNMGVITSKHGSGNYLAGKFKDNLVETMSMMFLLDQIDYKQINQLRRSLELQALLLAIDNISEREADDFSASLVDLEHVTEENNILLDKKLHLTIAKASKNALIIDMLQALSDVIEQFTSDFGREKLTSSKSKFILWKAHNNMLGSLVTRDKELAYKAINMYFDMLDLQETSLKL
ncbi:FadR/GntR family transcriptional regulator [Clostridium omnivorum]|uniref:GntR family transcriptional regulator n=1 Tax=Clostridium omnivorum TaxID=1604902 RepID=A0ABQ5N907_9CLOT|nr:GntR family transcriptional regulator [Clostridium sp. E14]GLC31758.1 GntR family transcriptional regulator [Clostridium sp. E14]